MAGVDFRDGTLVVDRPPNELDELAVSFSTLLQRLDVDHAFVAGYLAVLTGRARATEDIDVFVEPLTEAETAAVVDELEAAGFWGPAMPLTEMYRNLSAGTNVWVAPDGQMTPHIEAKFPSDEFDEASLSNAIDATVGGETIPVGPLELQIAYKLSLGTRTDLEDAAHFYAVFEESLSTARLERWVERLGVSDEYDRLRS